jgi:hypothetical protein
MDLVLPACSRNGRVTGNYENRFYPSRMNSVKLSLLTVHEKRKSGVVRTTLLENDRRSLGVTRHVSTSRDLCLRR